MPSTHGQAATPSPPRGAPRSPDGRYWWDGAGWRPVPARPGRRADQRVWLGLALIAVLVVAGCGIGLLVSSHVPARPRTATPKPLAVTFDIPPGFVEDDHAYKIEVPLYKHLTTRWVRPTDEPLGLDVIFVNSYVTGEDEHGAADGILRRIAAYDREVSAVHVTRPVRTRVNHQDAWSQEVYQPLASTTQLAMYESTYVFIGQDLIQIGCQWDQERSEVMRACGIVLSTLRIRR